MIVGQRQYQEKEGEGATVGKIRFLSGSLRPLKNAGFRTIHSSPTPDFLTLSSTNVCNNRGVANVGGGLEYRFTPHIGLFGEAGYNWVGGGNHNFNSSVKDFVQVNFGLRYAF